MAKYYTLNRKNVEDDQVLEVSGRVYAILKEARHLYPQFTYWYFGKFIRGLIKGSRSIVLCTAGNAIAAVALLKHDCSEKKICTIEVIKQYRGVGLGRRLFELSFDVLNTSKPLISIADERLPYFSSITRYYGFTLEKVHKGYYRPTSTEYVFNGSLSETDLTPEEQRRLPTNSESLKLRRLFAYPNVPSARRMHLRALFPIDHLDGLTM
jgi:GNAT superfamily N-acetyltransferase